MKRLIIAIPVVALFFLATAVWAFPPSYGITGHAAEKDEKNPKKRPNKPPHHQGGSGQNAQHAPDHHNQAAPPPNAQHPPHPDGQQSPSAPVAQPPSNNPNHPPHAQPGPSDHGQNAHNPGPQGNQGQNAHNPEPQGNQHPNENPVYIQNGPYAPQHHFHPGEIGHPQGNQPPPPAAVHPMIPVAVARRAPRGIVQRNVVYSNFYGTTFWGTTYVMPRMVIGDTRRLMFVLCDPYGYWIDNMIVTFIFLREGQVVLMEPAMIFLTPADFTGWPQNYYGIDCSSLPPGEYELRIRVVYEDTIQYQTTYVIIE